MKLLIISAMPHYHRGKEIVGWGPTVREINELPCLFEEIRHVACLHAGPPPETSLPYLSDRIMLVPVPPSGGETLASKVGILRKVPQYVRTLLRELPLADVVHVRCPANISLMAVVMLTFIRHPSVRWVKYAGNWMPSGREALSYRFQRWWLRKGYHRGFVTINGQWPAQPDHVHSLLNPCFTDLEFDQAKEIGLKKSLEKPVRMIYAGRLEAAKGVGRALRIVSELNKQRIPATLDLVGDGPERGSFEMEAASLGVSHLVRFHGWQPREKLNALYAQSHFFLMPCTSSEGWPKVLSESMAYGVVPLAGNLSSIPQYLGAFQTGKALPATDIQAYARAILEYCSTPNIWDAESKHAVRAASQFTYNDYLQAVGRLIGSRVEDHRQANPRTRTLRKQSLAGPVSERGERLP